MNNKPLIAILSAIIIIGGGIVLVNYLNKPDDRNAIQRVGDAVEEMPDVDKAANQLEDRTPAQKIGDSIDDATNGSHK